MKIEKDPELIVSKKEKKRIIKRSRVVICSILLVSVSIAGFYIYNNIRKHKIYEGLDIAFASNKEIEYGTDNYNPLDLVKKVNLGTIKSYTKTVDTSSVGTKQLVFEVAKDDVVKKVSVDVLVKDTKAPTIELKNAQVSIYAGEAYDIKSNIEKISDVVDGDIPYSETELDNSAYYIISTDFNNNNVGTYTVNIKASDTNGNTNEASYQINVNAKPKPKIVSKPKTAGSTYNGPASVDTSSVVNAAQSLIGSKYTHGGTSPTTGFDCSGFVQYIYSAVGKSISRTSRTQENDGMAVDKANLQPGDIIIWARKGTGTPSHSSIYVGDNTIVHAINSQKGVQKTNLTSWESYGYDIDAIRRV